MTPGDVVSYTPGFIVLCRSAVRARKNDRTTG
jgi:hypothetical protein